jgi:hypothetical protein
MFGTPSDEQQSICGVPAYRDQPLFQSRLGRRFGRTGSLSNQSSGDDDLLPNFQISIALFFTLQSSYRHSNNFEKKRD